MSKIIFLPFFEKERQDCWLLFSMQGKGSTLFLNCYSHAITYFPANKPTRGISRDQLLVFKVRVCHITAKLAEAKNLIDAAQVQRQINPTSDITKFCANLKLKLKRKFCLC